MPKTKVEDKQQSSAGKDGGKTTLNPLNVVKFLNAVEKTGVHDPAQRRPIFAQNLHPLPKPGN